MKEKQLRYSVLGDSISTFAGLTPSGGVFYDGYVCRETGVCRPEDTWWMQVISALDGELLNNNSYSGSTVSGGELLSGTSMERLKALGEGGEPDVILVHMGANDWGFGAAPQEFEYEYRRMIQRMKRLYPNAQIYCATLVEGEPPKEETLFFNLEGLISQRIYSDRIRKVAEEEKVCLADIGRHGVTYETVDGIHPNREGMRTLANLWLKEIGEN